MENIVLVGGGGHCKSVIDVIEQENKYHIIGIIDIKENIGNSVLGYKIIGCDNDLSTIFKTCKNAVVSVGQIDSNNLRVMIFEKLKDIGYTLPIIISPLSYVSKHATLQKGTIVMHNALINANTTIGENCIINTNTLIEHDCTIGDNCHIATAAVVNGGVIIKDNTFFGSNATSKEYIQCEGFIKAGSVVK